MPTLAHTNGNALQQSPTAIEKSILERHTHSQHTLHDSWHKLASTDKERHEDIITIREYPENRGAHACIHAIIEKPSKREKNHHERKTTAGL